jgi:putative transposase
MTISILDGVDGPVLDVPRSRVRLFAVGSMAYWNRVKLDFSRPGRPSDNAFCESFNNRVRQELLNPNWFRSLADARVQASAWRRDYNANHPHSSLGNLSPEEYARRAKNITPTAAISGEIVA